MGEVKFHHFGEGQPFAPALGALESILDLTRGTKTAPPPSDQ